MTYFDKGNYYPKSLKRVIVINLKYERYDVKNKLIKQSITP